MAACRIGRARGRPAYSSTRSVAHARDGWNHFGAPSPVLHTRRARGGPTGLYESWTDPASAVQPPGRSDPFGRLACDGGDPVVVVVVVEDRETLGLSSGGDHQVHRLHSPVEA